jgi:hypothetical protein
VLELHRPEAVGARPSSSISCGVNRIGAVGGSAVGFGCFGMVDSIAEQPAKRQSATPRQGKW